MHHFQVISSTLSTTGIAEFVSGKYSLPGNVVCRLLKTGINHTYLISADKASFIFRIYSYQWRSRAEITEELRLLNFLKQNNVSISWPVADSDGNYIQTVNAPEGERFAVLFSHAEGHKIQNYNSDVHFEVGKLLAQIHKLTKDFTLDRISYTADVLLKDSLENIKQFLSSDTEEMQFLLDTKPLLEKEITHANTNFIKKGAVHLDIWFDNLNISDNKKITLFDFDFCGNGWLCLDIAYYVMQLYNIEKNETERLQKMESFLKGYNTMYEISAEEMRVVPILGVCLYYFYLGIQCRRFDNWSNTFLNEVYLKRYISVLIKGYYNSIKNNTVQ